MYKGYREAIDCLWRKISFAVIFIFVFAASSLYAQNGFWLKADFHMHTTMSDADNTPEEVAEHALREFGLDVIAISEHGGNWFRLNKEFQRTDEEGKVLLDGKDYSSIMATDAKRFKNYSRTIQLRNNSFPEILRLREKYPDKLIFQGLEWDIPGHDHGSTGIIADEAEPIASFHYMFDRRDTDYKGESNLTKQNEDVHANALTGIKYLEKNYPDKSYFIVNHPSRIMKYKIADFRDFNNASPEISIGFEGIPGHQKSPGIRCEYNKELGDGILYNSKTYGGADYTLAKVGGLWDAMLGEGRKFWVFTNSDYHRTYSDFWPGQYAVNYIWSDGRDYKSLVKGMKSGKVFVVQNKLITDLVFSAEAGKQTATMGQTLTVAENSVVKITVKFISSPKDSIKKTYSVDHVDLICGDVTGMINPDSPEYNNPTNPTTKIEKQFFKFDWTAEGNYSSFSYEIKADKSKYIRLRGTNIPLNTLNESDSDGNPLVDSLVGENSDLKALADLWFYSNPIFIEVAKNN